MPGHDTLLSIARYFGVSTDYLLGNENTAQPFPLEHEFCDGMSYSSFLCACDKLSPNQRHAVLTMVKTLLEK